MFEHRPDTAEVIGGDVVHPKYGMRITDVGHGRRMQDWLVDGPNLQLDGTRVGKGLGERNVAPAEFRRAHIDADVLPPGHIDLQAAGLGFELEGAASRLFRFEPTYAAHAVAAGLRLRPSAL